MLDNERLKYRRGTLVDILLRKINRKSLRLKGSINTYPPYRPPHPDSAELLSDAQAEENFAFFQSSRQQRLHHILELLTQFEIAFNPANPDSESLIALDNWAYQQWPALYRKNIARFPFSTFAFEAEELAIRSLLFDVSILLGECYLAINRDASWCMDLSPVSASKQLASWHRIVINLETVPVHTQPWPNILDIEDHVFYHFNSQEKHPTFINADWNMGTILGEPVMQLIHSSTSKK